MSALTAPSAPLPPRVGVLSLQGDFACHQASLETLGVEVRRVTLPPDLAGLDAIVLPGGESTTMLRLLDATGLRAPLESFVRERPVLGTCAGVILLGRGAAGLPAPPFAVLDVAVERNAYGRQIDSFEAELEAPAVGGVFHGVFIRAPRIVRVGEGVEVVARRRQGTGGAPGEPVVEPVGVRAGNVVGLCFHPELTSDLRFHRWFLTDVAGLRLPGVRQAAGEGAALSRRGAA
ncbi:MAG: pyridoxal 5'-phosphate synthase glutaminase subunit PdxT [Candidatus Eiseniibacteriota bacterium]